MSAVKFAADSATAFARLLERLYGDGLPSAIAIQLWQAVSAGHTGLPLNQISESDRSALMQLLAGAEARSEGPGLLRVEFGHVYLPRYAAIESRIASNLLARVSQCKSADAAPASTDIVNSAQQRALQAGLLDKLLLLTGGPGTGKSFTLRAIVKASRLDSPAVRIAALAPTANAAQRLADVGADFVGTVHKVLGIAPGRSINPSANGYLPFDLVIVDEASMLSAQLADALLSRLDPHSRLILAGDRNQLGSVEAGAIFSQACALQSNLVELTENYRFGDNDRLAQFASTLVSQHTHEVAEQIRTRALPLMRHDLDTPLKLLDFAQSSYRPLLEMALRDARVEEMMEGMKAFRLLVSTNEGPYGVDLLSDALDLRLRHLAGSSRASEWYTGRLIVITHNDHATGLRNGQTGVCMKSSGGFVVLFDDGRHYPVQRLPAYRSAWAITVHKAQGAEFMEVLLVLPGPQSPLAIRELLYTGCTRARERLGIVGSIEAVQACVANAAVRYGGLTERLTSAVN